MFLIKVLDRWEFDSLVNTGAKTSWAASQESVVAPGPAAGWLHGSWLFLEYDFLHIRPELCNGALLSIRPVTPQTQRSVPGIAFADTRATG